MIVVDASIIAPVVLIDEEPWPEHVATRLTSGPLAAPPHWPVEVVNLLHVAERRGRLTRAGRQAAIERMRDFGVVTSLFAPDAGWMGISALADRHGLTAYDAAYLHLALTSGASLASLDRALVAAAASYDLDVVTY